jgi:DNA-binding NtrC family response regulator
LISADADERLVVEARSAQAFSVLSKPVSQRTVMQIVRQALKRTYNWPPA